MHTHEVPDLQHNCMEFFIVLGNRGPLPQVKQVGVCAATPLAAESTGSNCTENLRTDLDPVEAAVAVAIIQL